MASLGFSNHSIIRFQSYLPDRSFRVNIKDKNPSTTKIECRVPQLRTFAVSFIPKLYETGCKL